MLIGKLKIICMLRVGHKRKRVPMCLINLVILVRKKKKRIKRLNENQNGNVFIVVKRDTLKSIVMITLESRNKRKMHM